ncbi:hypothetical protein BBP40_000017 [Aspergillus hancockii]|nr:hypothetical protein BBP40_000017 [Aspergillus hancockii]
MHYSTLLAATLAVAPAVYGYGVVKVQVNSHEDCPAGKLPGHNLKEHFAGKPVTAFPTKDTCSKVKLNHDDKIDTYSFTATPVTKDAFVVCHGLAVYASGECAGLPDVVVPFKPGESKAQSPCLPEYAFEKNVALQLLCEDKRAPKQEVEVGDKKEDGEVEEKHKGEEEEEKHEDKDKSEKEGKHEEDEKSEGEKGDEGEEGEKGDEDKPEEEESEHGPKAAPKAQNKPSLLKGLGL